MSLSIPVSILGQVWYLIVLIPNLCTLTYFYEVKGGWAVPGTPWDTSLPVLLNVFYDQ